MGCLAHGAEERCCPLDIACCSAGEEDQLAALGLGTGPDDRSIKEAVTSLVDGSGQFTCPGNRQRRAFDGERASGHAGKRAIVVIKPDTA